MARTSRTSSNAAFFGSPVSAAGAEECRRCRRADVDGCPLACDPFGLDPVRTGSVFGPGRSGEPCKSVLHWDTNVGMSPAQQPGETGEAPC